MSEACRSLTEITGKVDFAICYANDEILAVTGISDRKIMWFAAGSYNHWIMNTLAFCFTFKKFCI